MGHYIYVSIATQILVSKRSQTFPYQEMSMKEICDQMSRYFSMELYDCYENEKMVSMVLKDGVLKAFLYDFLLEQSYYLFCGEEIRKDILKIKDKDDEEVIYMMSHNVLDYFHYDDFSCMKPFYHLKNLNVYFEGIQYLSDGKVYLEECSEFFGYIHDMMRQAFHNPLTGATYLHID